MQLAQLAGILVRESSSVSVWTAGSWTLFIWPDVCRRISGLGEICLGAHWNDGA